MFTFGAAKWQKNAHLKKTWMQHVLKDVERSLVSARVTYVWQDVPAAKSWENLEVLKSGPTITYEPSNPGFILIAARTANNLWPTVHIATSCS